MKGCWSEWKPHLNWESSPQLFEMVKWLEVISFPLWNGIYWKENSVLHTIRFCNMVHKKRIQKHMEQTLKSYVEQSQHGTCDHHNSSYFIYFLRRILHKLKPLCTGNGKYIMVYTNYNRFHVSLLVLSNTQVRSEVSLFARKPPHEWNLLGRKRRSIIAPSCALANLFRPISMPSVFRGTIRKSSWKEHNISGSMDFPPCKS